MKNLLLTICLIFILSIANAQQTGLFSRQIEWTNSSGSQTRTSKVYVPLDYDQSTEYSLVIGLHGLGDNISNYLQNIKYFTQDSYFGNVILVCPDDGTPSTSWFSGDEDFDILQAVINNIEGTHNLDLSRVFVQGFSFGGKSAYLHGLEEADYIRGIIAYSPGFYNSNDINNSCTDPLHCQHDYNYENASKVLVCITAGSGEYNLGLTEPYLDLAQEAVIKLNVNGGDAIFIEDPNGYHNLPPVSISKQCWDHVNKQLAVVNDISNDIDVNLFPNPASDFINIDMGRTLANVNVEIVSVIGQILISKDFEGKDIVEIDIHTLKPGVYFVNIIIDNKPGFINQLIVK